MIIYMYDICTCAYPTIRCNALWGTRMAGLSLNAMRRCWLIRMSESKDVWLEFTGEGNWSDIFYVMYICVYICTREYIHIMYISIYTFWPPFDCFYIHFGHRLIVFFMKGMPGVQHGAVLQSRAVLPGRTAGSFGTGTEIANSSFSSCGCFCGWKLPRTARRLCFISSLWSDFWDSFSSLWIYYILDWFSCRSTVVFHPLRPLQLNSLLSTITPKVPSILKEGPPQIPLSRLAFVGNQWRNW